MVNGIHRPIAVCSALCLIFGSLSYAKPRPAQPHPYLLPAVSMKQRVVWGSVCEGPDGMALAFGGEDQQAIDGVARTRLRVDQRWIELEQELAQANPLGDLVQDAWELVDGQKHRLSMARSMWLEGLPPDELEHRTVSEVLPRQQRQSAEIDAMVRRLKKKPARAPGTAELAQKYQSIRAQNEALVQSLQKDGITAGLLGRMRQIQVMLDKAGGAVCTEPPGRALSAIVYEPKQKLFVLFGGDHFDYLSNDTWVFDPAIRRWSLRHPPSAPPPRANHAWKVNGDGKVVVTGGYAYDPNTEYKGGQYIDIDDGEWTYDVVADTWSGDGKGMPADSRTYRTGPFLPEYFFEGPRPDSGVFQAMLKSLPANVWKKTSSPRCPQMGPDFGSAVIDPLHDLILRFPAYGGTGVIAFHLASNRWELGYPAEFPLGQLYAATEYPDGINFNHRPWINSRTYQNYGVDPGLKKLVFVGHPPASYQYDPTRGDWTASNPVPSAMNYPDAISTLITTATPDGLICWTASGQLFRLDALLSRWNQVHTAGEALPGSVADRLTVVYDGRRDRLLFFRKPAGDNTEYDGEIYSVDMKSRRVSRLSPAGRAAAAAISDLCQIGADSAHDLLLVGATLPAGPDGIRRTPAYDCAGNKWISLKITGDDPNASNRPNATSALVYDARRDLFWAINAQNEIFVLRLDLKSADASDLVSP